MRLSSIYKSLVLLLAFGITTITNAQNDKKKIIDQIQELSLKSTVVPMDLGTMIMDSVKLSVNSLEYFNTVKSEQAYNYNLYNSEGLKKILLSSYTENEANALAALLCLDSGKDIKYHYYNTKGKRFTISFNHAQLLSALGISEITPDYRVRVVEKSLIAATSPYEVGYKLLEINKDYLEVGLYVERIMSKEEKQELSPRVISAFLSKDILSLMPLYALYLEKGYKYSIIEPQKKKNKPYKYSYNDLSEIFEYINMPRREELYEEPIKQTIKTEKKEQQFECIKPTFNGGDANEFSKWVASQVNYPKKAIEYCIQGKAILKFTIDVDGSVTNVRVIKSIHPDVDEEVARVILSSPRWTPGKQDGQPVPVTYTFPFIYQFR